MKNKNQFLSMCIMVLACVFVFTSCKKKETGTADPNAKQHNEDVSNTKSESDNVNTDVNTVLNGITGTGKTDETNAAISICGATIDSSQQNGSPKTIIIHFDGTTACGNPARIRGGDVKIELINWINHLVRNANTVRSGEVTLLKNGYEKANQYSVVL